MTPSRTSALPQGDTPMSSPSPVSTQAAASQVMAVLPRVMDAMRRAMRAQLDGPLTVPQFRGLNFIDLRPGSSVSDLAGFLGVSLATASAMVDRLARAGHVQTQGSRDDRHGVVWPLLGAEDETTEVRAQIEAVLKECGVHEIQNLEHPFPLEYCEDCGAPLYPSPEGEVVHAEMPEEQAEQMPRHL